MTLQEEDDELLLQEEDDDPPEAILVGDDEDVHKNDQLETDELRDLLDDPSDDGPVIRRRGNLFRDIYRAVFPGRKKARQNRWDSPLILLGGGGLVLLVAAGFGIFSLLYSESVDDVFTEAEDAYQSQSYGVAIEKFERLAARYPQNENASISRVRAELARLRQFTDTTSPDWRGALAQAQSGLPQVSGEDAFSEVRQELAKLLPDIAQGLVEQANRSDALDEKKQLVAQARESLELVHNPVYLPTTVKSSQELRIESIESTVDIVQRDIQREEALQATTEQIQAAAGEGRIVEAYRLRDDLLARYPILTGNATLRDALSNVADKEREAVTSEPGATQPLTDDHPPVSRVQLVLSDNRGTTAAGLAADAVYPVLARGAVYGLRASDGAVRWRRFVGYETDVYPQPIGTGAFLLVDQHHSELQRVDADSGQLQWRLPVAGPIGTPFQIGDRAFVCAGFDAVASADQTSTSRLLAIDLATGQILKTIRFPVGCKTQPGLLSDGQLAVVGTHSSIYILDIQTLTCDSVLPSGHVRDSIAVPPVWLGKSLLVPVNTGNRSAQMRRYTPTEDGNWAIAGEPMTFTGRIVSPPATDSQRLLVHTDMGEIRTFEMAVDGLQLRELAAISATDVHLGETHVDFSGSQLWIADQKLTRYQLQATRGELVRQLVRDRRDQFLNPIRRFGNYLLTVRQRNEMLGVTVAAHPAGDTKGEPVWETDLAVPSEILVSPADTVHAVTANGAMFPIDAEAVRTGITDRRDARVDPLLMPQSFSQALRVSSAQAVFVGPPPISHFVVADLQTPNLRRAPLRIASDVATVPLVAFQGGLLAACETGPIHWLDAANGRAVSQPFVPPTGPGQAINWLLPAPRAGSERFLAAQRSGKLYLVAKQGTTLAIVGEGEIGGPLVAGLAALESTGFAVANTSGADELVIFQADDLTVQSTQPLAQGVAWGPQTVGDRVLVVDGTHNLSVFDGRGALTWTTQLPGALAGVPLGSGGKMVFATTDGSVSVVDSEGTITAQHKLAEPLGGGPVAFKGRLIVQGWDGTLYLVDVPRS